MFGVCELIRHCQSHHLDLHTGLVEHEGDRLPILLERHGALLHPCKRLDDRLAPLSAPAWQNPSPEATPSNLTSLATTC